MASLNKVQLIGHLGGDPESRITDNDVTITNFSIATNEQWTDKNTGEKISRTEWHRIVAFNKTADICAEFLNKGSLVYVEGKLKNRSYEKDGHGRYVAVVVARKVLMLDKKTQECEWYLGP
ncbi:MAG: single-stranded DNA-binding protein [Proteobacteria bacterium]|nr:single-stranded DNA-binding protein [Pseudomonadota bacterium]